MAVWGRKAPLSCAVGGLDKVNLFIKLMDDSQLKNIQQSNQIKIWTLLFYKKLPKF